MAIRLHGVRTVVNDMKGVGIMATTAIAPLQTPWDCRWSRPGRRFTGIPDALQPERVWVCVRDGHRRNLREDQCVTCAHWERDSASIAHAAETKLPAAASPTIKDVARLALRLVMLATAVLIFGTGVAILTRPLAIPFAIGLWICGAIVAVSAIFGRFDAAEKFVEQE
jgi:hypothetical protein